MHYILFIHILGGVASFVIVIGTAILVILRSGSPRLMRFLIMLSMIFQVITGILLIVFVPQISIASVCIKGFGYLVIAGLIHYLINWRFAEKN